MSGPEERPDGSISCQQPYVALIMTTAAVRVQFGVFTCPIFKKYVYICVSWPLLASLSPRSPTSWPCRRQRLEAELVFLFSSSCRRVLRVLAVREFLSVPNEERSEWWKEIESWDDSVGGVGGHPWKGKWEGSSCRSNTEDVYTGRMSEGKLEVGFWSSCWCCKCNELVCIYSINTVYIAAIVYRNN